MQSYSGGSRLENLKNTILSRGGYGIIYRTQCRVGGPILKMDFKLVLVPTCRCQSINCRLKIGTNTASWYYG